MTANEDDQFSEPVEEPVEASVEEPIDDFVDDIKPVPKKNDSKVVAAEPADRAKQPREKAKKKKSNAFVAYLKKADPIALTCFVIILLASVVVIGSYINSEYIDVSNGGTATSGSTVEVEYVGSYLTYYGEDGAVIFDTNIESVAKDESMVFSGSYKDSESYDYLKFTIGGTDVLKAFGDACAGHSEGDVVKVAIPATDITDSSDIRQSYGKVAREDNVPKTVTVPLNGTMSLNAFNRLCGTSYTSSDFPVTSATPIKGVDCNAGYDNDLDLVCYTLIGVAASESAELTVGTPIAISDVTATDFKITYTSTDNSVQRGIAYDGAVVSAVFVEHKAGEDTISTYIDDFSDITENGHPEPKGETMYFWIKIKSVA